MLESDARTIVHMATPAYIDKLTEEEVVSFRSEYCKAYLKIYGSTLNEEELREHIAVGAKCIVCRHDACRCIQRAEPYIMKYGSIWCRSCGYKYYESGGEDIPWFYIDSDGRSVLFSEQHLVRINETTWRLPDGRFYRMYYPYLSRRRVPCTDCSPVFVQSMMKALEVEKAGARTYI